MSEFEDNQLAIEKERTKQADIQARSRQDRRPYVAGFFAGLAVLIAVLALIGSVWHYNTNHDNQKTRQIRECMTVQGTWVNDNTCVPPREAK